MSILIIGRFEATQKYRDYTARRQILETSCGCRQGRVQKMANVPSKKVQRPPDCFPTGNQMLFLIIIIIIIKILILSLIV